MVFADFQPARNRGPGSSGAAERSDAGAGGQALARAMP